jgi:hypothetical protein
MTYGAKTQSGTNSAKRSPLAAGRKAENAPSSSSYIGLGIPRPKKCSDIGRARAFLMGVATTADTGVGALSTNLLRFVHIHPITVIILLEPILRIRTHHRTLIVVVV